ncbi:MAG TPA: hypothetical protein VKR06_18995 [Ktedonosporobacter sp.]|nr:hypothetical protein [Ktedonosporobacter sp.]
MVRRFSRHFGPPWAQRNWEGGRLHQISRHHGPHGHHHGWHNISPEQQALRSTAAEVARLFAKAFHSSIENTEKQAQFRALLERSRKELSDIIYGTTQSANEGSALNVENV